MDFFEISLKVTLFIKEITCKFYREFILKGILLYFFSRSDKFIQDFSFKFEVDFNFLVNFFKGISFIILKLISFFNARYRVFFARKCFIPRREIRSISSRGPIEVSFHLLNFGLERVYWTSKTYRVYRVFFARKCFIVTG